MYVFASPEDGYAESELQTAIEDAIVNAIGGIARPNEVVFTPDLPKTRSGNVMRRLLTSVANDEDLGDTSALRNPEILGEIQSTTRRK